jgi:hypothetical protein
VKIKFAEPPKTLSTCPIINQKYVGDCPAYECPANLVRLTQGKSKGCYHIKHKTTIEDFGKLWNLDERAAKAAYSNSISLLEKMVNLYQMLQELREQSTWKYSCCNCGAPLKNNYNSCLNVTNCTRRAKLINKQKERIPFSLPGLNIRKIDIWLFARKYSKNELRQKLGVYFPEALWDILPPLIAEEIEKEAKPT